MEDAVVDSQPIGNNTLITEDELKNQAKELQQTLLGSMFPVLPIEYSRFILMACAFFIIAYTYTFLRLYKDNVIYSVLEPSAQNWLKIFTFFASVLAAGMVQKLLAFLDMDKAFEVATAIFGSMLLAMAVLIKFREYVQFKDGWAEEFFIANTADCRGISILYVLALIFNHWVLSLFYVLCEVIGSIMVSFIFLTYVNSHCTADQNSRFVRILYIFSNVAGFAAARMYNFWNDSMKKHSYEVRESFYVYFTIGSVVLFGIVIALKKLLDRVFANPIVVPSGKPKKIKRKASVSMTDGIYYAFVSKLLLAMCAMTLFYNISANLLTSLFSNSLKAAASILGEDNASFGAEYKSREMSYTAILVIFVMVSPFSKLFEWFGVASSGSIPILISFLGAIFCTYFAVLNYPALGSDNMRIASYWNDAKRSPMGEVYTNLIVSSAVKISKYAFFDIIKEAISMKIDADIRPLFKGVYDGVCGKLGKCAGSIYGLTMEMLTGERDARYYAPVTCLIIITFCLIWSWAIYYLHYSFKEAKANNTYMSPDYFEGVVLKAE